MPPTSSPPTSRAPPGNRGAGLPPGGESRQEDKPGIDTGNDHAPLLQRELEAPFGVVVSGWALIYRRAYQALRSLGWCGDRAWRWAGRSLRRSLPEARQAVAGAGLSWPDEAPGAGHLRSHFPCPVAADQHLLPRDPSGPGAAHSDR